MPEFEPGSSHTAIATMSNPTSKAFDYIAELYMGTDLALMASTPFHLEAGESKDISLPVTMPTTAGTYPVHIGVFSGGVNIALYHAEDVVIAPVGVAEFAYVSGITWEEWYFPGGANGLRYPKVSVKVQNQGGASGLCSLSQWSQMMYFDEDVYRMPAPNRSGDPYPEHLEAVIAPGEIETFYAIANFATDNSWGWGLFKAYEVWFYNTLGEIRQRII